MFLALQQYRYVFGAAFVMQNTEKVNVTVASFLWQRRIHLNAQEELSDPCENFLDDDLEFFVSEPFGR